MTLQSAMSKEIAFFSRLVKGLIKHNAERMKNIFSQLAVALVKAFLRERMYQQKKHLQVFLMELAMCE